MAVITPSGGTITYILDKMIIDEVVVDYLSGQVVPNYPPRIKSLAADKLTVLLGEDSNIYCAAEDRDGDTLSYSWFTSSGTINGSGANVIWSSPNIEGIYAIICRVEDDYGNQVSDTIYIEVAEYINNDPIILLEPNELPPTQSNKLELKIICKTNGINNIKKKNLFFL